MGRYDQHIIDSQKMYDKAKADYDDALIKMKDAAPHVRDFVLNTYQSEMDEAQQMIQTFTTANSEG